MIEFDNFVMGELKNVQMLEIRSSQKQNSNLKQTLLL